MAIKYEIFKETKYKHKTWYMKREDEIELWNMNIKYENKI